MENSEFDCYLFIESEFPEKTAEFYRALGLKVVEGFQLGDYLVSTPIGCITINKKSFTCLKSNQAYKPVVNINLTRENTSLLIQKLRDLGFKITEVGEFLNLAVYECEDFSGGVICLQIGICAQPN